MKAQGRYQMFCFNKGVQYNQAMLDYLRFCIENTLTQELEMHPASPAYAHQDFLIIYGVFQNQHDVNSLRFAKQLDKLHPRHVIFLAFTGNKRPSSQEQVHRNFKSILAGAGKHSPGGSDVPAPMRRGYAGGTVGIQGRQAQG